YQEGMEQPTIFWVPAIATSGLTFYTGDKFPNWKNNLFAGGMRQGEVPRSGHLDRIDFNDKWEELHRESMLRELQQRIRDVRQGPDGFLYVLTAETDGVLMRLEPAPLPPPPAGRGRGGQAPPAGTPPPGRAGGGRTVATRWHHPSGRNTSAACSARTNCSGPGLPLKAINIARR